MLLALAQKGVAREDAYRLVQRNAMKVWAGGGDFLTLLKADPGVRKYLSETELAANFDLDFHMTQVDTIFARVFGRALTGVNHIHSGRSARRRGAFVALPDSSV